MRLRSFWLQIVFLVLLTASSPAADHATVFLYHRFGDSLHSSTNVSLEDFRAHLQILRDGRYHVVTLGELVAMLTSGVPLPERTVALSIDDGYRSFQEGALPLLREYGYPATIFLSTETVGGDDFLGWSEIAQLVKAGFEIGNHSARHDYLLDRRDGEPTEVWLARVEQDLLSAQRTFAGRLGFEPELFAYPYGEYDPQIVALVKRLGFKAAFGQQSGVVSADQDRYVLPRFSMTGAFSSSAQFKDRLAMRPLPVTVIAPNSPRLGADDNPPLLTLQIDLSGLDVASLRCYVNGDPDQAIIVSGSQAGRYEIRAKSRLEERRNKYTLTASDRSGRQWFWFSQLWVSARP